MTHSSLLKSGSKIAPISKLYLSDLKSQSHLLEAFGYLSAPARSITQNMRRHYTLYYCSPAGYINTPSITQIIIKPLAICFASNIASCLNTESSTAPCHPIGWISTLSIMENFIESSANCFASNITSCFNSEPSTPLCHPILLTILQLQDVGHQLLSFFIRESVLQHMAYAWLQLFFCIYSLSVDLSVPPKFLAHYLWMYLMKSLFFKHDFRCRWRSYFECHPSLHVTTDVVSLIFSVHKNLKCHSLQKYFVILMLECALLPVTRNITPVTSAEHENRFQTVGGGVHKSFSTTELRPYIMDWSADRAPTENEKLKFVAYMTELQAQTQFAEQKDVVFYDCPVSFLLPCLTLPNLHTVASNHDMFVDTRWGLPHTRDALNAHTCVSCPKFFSIFEVIKSTKKKDNNQHNRVTKCHSRKNSLQKSEATRKNTDA
jgi:hypothetical protein